MVAAARIEAVENRSALDAVARLAARATEVALATMMAAMIGLVLWAVVGRFLLHSTPNWLEETAGFLFVWIVLLGGALGVYRDTNPRVNVLMDRLPAIVRGDLRLVADVTVLAYAAFLVDDGARFIHSVRNIIAPGSGVSMAYADASLAVAGGLMTLFMVRAIYRETQWNVRRIAIAAGIAVVWCAIIVRGVPLPASTLFELMLGGIVVLLLLGVPVAFAIGAATLMSAAMASNLPLLLIPQNMMAGLNNFILLAVPFFLVVGAIMSSGTSAQRLLRVANSFVGSIRGGIGLADIVASAIFADISGSAIADSAAIGSVITPELRRQGFRPEFATALQAAAGSLGILFPPSITMILYAWVANVSISQLFLSLFIPGLLVTASFMVLVYATAQREQLPASGRWSWTEIRASLKSGWGPLLMPFLILGGILSGVTTPTEAGVIAVVYAAMLAAVYREIPLRRCAGVLVEAAMMTGRIGLIIATARALGWLMVAYQGPQHMLETLLSVSHNQIAMLLMVMLFLIIIHTVVEGATTILVVVPLLLPALAMYGVDLRHFGVLLNLNSAIGLILPPTGICLYIACSMTGVSVGRATKFALPFAGVLLADLLLLIFVPQLSGFLPAFFAPK